MRVWRAAADTDPGLAAGLDAGLAQQRATALAALGLMAGRDLKPEEADWLWALHGDEVYRLLVQHAGWSHERYETWLAGVALRLLATEGLPADSKESYA